MPLWQSLLILAAVYLSGAFTAFVILPWIVKRFGQCDGTFHVPESREEVPPFEPMIEGEDGWAEWIHPIPGYRMQCCDCGLVHELEFAIVPFNGEPTEFNAGESAGAGVIVFRARRAPCDSGRLPEGEAGTAECAASQSGPKGIAPIPTNSSPSPIHEGPNSRKGEQDHA